MKKIVAITILLLLVTPLNLISQTNLQSGVFTVSESLVTIKIPIIHQNKYTWFKPDTLADAAEYICFIDLDNYFFGFSVFKLKGAKEKNGNINELFADGQLDVWEKHGNYNTIIPKHKVKVSFSAPIPFIVLEISNPQTIKMLFADKPATAFYRIQGFKSDYPEGKITIVYTNI